MRYVLLIYGDEKLNEQVTEERWQEVMTAHRAFGAEAEEKGMNPGGEALQPTGQARTVRFEDSRPVMVTDGPFAETKEQLGGFYVLDCESMDEAIEMAKKLPMWVGSVEIRPAVMFD